MLFYTLFRLLARAPTPPAALRQGAVVGALGFEALKLCSTLLLVSTSGRPAFQALGIALIVLIWINYFSRIVMYAAAWAHTSSVARIGVPARVDDDEPPAPRSAPRGRVSARVAFGAGAASALGLVALLRRRRQE